MSGIDILSALEIGEWVHADYDSSAVASGGVLVAKPGLTVSPELLDYAAERLHEHGYQFTFAKRQSCAFAAEQQLLRKQYPGHACVAEEGLSSALELVRARQRANEIGASQAPIYPALDFVDLSGVDPSQLAAWHEQTVGEYGIDSPATRAPRRVGACAFLQLLDQISIYPDPVLLLNVHMISVLAIEVGWPDVFALLVQPITSQHDVAPWSVVKGEVVGRGEPCAWPSGSLRSMIHEGLLGCRYVDNRAVSATNSAVHLSAGPVETIREAQLWLGLDPDDSQLGKELAESGVDVRQLLQTNFVSIGGRNLDASLLTEGLDAGSAANSLRYGVVVRREAVEQLLHSVVAEAIPSTELLRRAPGVVAVFGTGSLAHDRATDNSDLDLVVVSSALGSNSWTERRVGGPLDIDIEWLSIDGAYERAAGGDRSVSAFRKRNRLVGAIALHDPSSLLHALQRVANETPVAVDDLSDQIEEVSTAGRDLLRSISGLGHVQGLQSLLDRLAILRLTRSGRGFTKAKWLLHDLACDGSDLLASLIRSLHPTALGATRSIQTVRHFVERMATVAGIPGPDYLRDVQLLPQHRTYVHMCRSIDDAASLARAGRYEEAAYVLGYSSRLALATFTGSLVDFGGLSLPQMQESYSYSGICRDLAEYLQSCAGGSGSRLDLIEIQRITLELIPQAAPKVGSSNMDVR